MIVFPEVFSTIVVFIKLCDGQTMIRMWQLWLSSQRFTQRSHWFELWSSCLSRCVIRMWRLWTFFIPLYYQNVTIMLIVFITLYDQNVAIMIVLSITSSFDQNVAIVIAGKAGLPPRAVARSGPSRGGGVQQDLWRHREGEQRPHNCHLFTFWGIEIYTKNMSYEQTTDQLNIIIVRNQDDKPVLLQFKRNLKSNLVNFRWSCQGWPTGSPLTCTPTSPPSTPTPPSLEICLQTASTALDSRKPFP